MIATKDEGHRVQFLTAAIAITVLAVSATLLLTSGELRIETGAIALVAAFGIWICALRPTISLGFLGIGIAGASIADLPELLAIPLAIPFVVAVYSYLYPLQVALSCTVILICVGSVDFAPGDFVIPTGILITWVMMLLGGFSVGRALQLLRRRNERIAKMRAASQVRAKKLQQALHDSIASELTRATLAADLLAEEQSISTENHEQIALINSSLRSASKGIGQLISYLDSDREQDLRVRATEGTLEEALQNSCRILGANGFEVKAVQSFSDKVLTSSQLEVLSNGLHELTTNILKYGAKREPVTIAVEQGADEIDLLIQNTINDEVLDQSSSGKGLLNIASEVESVGGRLRVLEAGTTWQMLMQIPLVNQRKLGEGDPLARYQDW